MKIKSFCFNGRVYYRGANTIEKMPMDDVMNLYMVLKKKGLNSFYMQDQKHSIEVLSKRIDDKFANLAENQPSLFR